MDHHHHLPLLPLLPLSLLRFALIHFAQKGLAQQFPPAAINLGTFSLQRSPYTGDLQVGLGQGANIFGFGGDRELGFNIGPGRFGTQIDNGLLLGGNRFGVDSHVGYQEGRGIDLGSMLKLFQPIGQFVPLGPSPAAPYRFPVSPQIPSGPPPPIVPTNSQLPGGRPWLPPALPPPMTTNSEEVFPSSAGNGWREAEAEEDPFDGERGGWYPSANPWSVGRARPSNDQRNAEEGKSPGKKEERQGQRTGNGSKLPLLDGLEPLTRTL